LKSILTYLLFISFAIQVMGSSITFLAYELNKDFIAKNLCVNKAKPKLHCNGKCHLMKELKKEEKRNESPENNSLLKTELVQICSFTTPFHFSFTVHQAVQYPIITEATCKINSPSVFHPPLA
jgi:hypothetical protein